MVVENARMRQLADTETNWVNSDPVLLAGEIAITTDINRIKVGDGTSQWSALPYYGIATPPSDGSFYGFKDANAVPGVLWDSFSGDLSTASYPNGTLLRLQGSVQNAWLNFSAENDYVLHMDYGDGKKLQIGFASPAVGSIVPMIHSRHYDGTSWSDWVTQSGFQPSAYIADLNALNVGSGWQASAPLGAGVSNGPTDVDNGAYLTHTQHDANLCTQVIYDTSDLTFPRIWMRQYTTGAWSNWETVGGSDRPMIWKGDWVPQQYNVAECVYDGGWLMIANKTTVDRPAPQPAGDAAYLYAGASPTDNVTAKQIVMGQRYTIPNDGTARQLNKYRVYTQTGVVYRVTLVRNVGSGDEKTDVISIFTGFQAGWTEFNVDPVFIQSGTVSDLLVVANEPDPTPTTFTLSYDYDTPNLLSPPTTGEMSQSNNRPDLLRFHKTDQNGDQSAQLATMQPGDVIRGAGEDWVIQLATDAGTYYEYIVSPERQGAPDGVQDFVFETVTASPITYMKDVDYWLSTPNVQGLFTQDAGSGSATPDDNAYGVDFEVETVVVSADWDFMAYTPNSDFSSGAGSGGDGITKVEGDLYYVNVDGDTMTGPLVMESNQPTIDFHDANAPAGSQRVRLKMNDQTIGFYDLSDTSVEEGEFWTVSAGSMTYYKPDGSDAMKITNNGVSNFYGTMFVNGVAVLYSNPQIRNDGNPSIDLLNAAGTLDSRIAYRRGTGLLWLDYHDGGTRDVAVFDDAGTALTYDQSVVTREKGDARYVELSGDTMTGALEVSNSSFIPLLQLTRGATNATMLLATAPYLEFQLNAATAARFEVDDVTANFDQTVMTRRKGDERYALAGTTGGATVSVGPTPPATPAAGDLWYSNVETAGLFVWYEDVDSSQWVQTNGGTPQESHDPTGVASYRIIGETLECWGEAAGGTQDVSVTLPKTYADTNYAVNITNSTNEGDVGAKDFTTTSFTAISQNTAANRRWHTIGKWDGVS